MTPDENRVIKLLGIWEASPAPKPSPLELAAGDQELERQLREAIRDTEMMKAVLSAPLRAASTRRSQPPNIDGYEIEATPREGGMGLVYKGRHTRTRVAVAVKIIHPHNWTPNAFPRFEQEAQHLQRLQQIEGIQRLIDFRLDPSQESYVITEWVEGVAIDEFVKHNGSSAREVAQLIAQVLDVIHYAHLNQSVHRDLKPAHVLVTSSSRPTIIDFGVAKSALEGDLQQMATLTFERPGTLEYMAPEQVRPEQPITALCDVYAIGKILFELLTGSRPYVIGARFFDAERIVCNPLKPSARQVCPSIDRDLDLIVSRAMEVEPSSRFQSAAAFAAELRRYLGNQPLTIAPPTLTVRLALWKRAHARWYAASLFVLLLFALAIPVLGLAYAHARAAQQSAENALVQKEDALREAQEQRLIAQRQAAIAEAVGRFQEDMLSAADPDRMMGDKVTVLDATREAIKRLNEGAFNSEPLVGAAVQTTIGNTLRTLSRTAEAEPLLRAALDTYQQRLPARDPLIATALNNLAELCEDQGKFADAERLSREALTMRRKALAGDHVDIANSLNNLAVILQKQGRLEDAEPLYREALQIRRRSSSPDPATVASTLNNLALLLREIGKQSDAEPLFREALALQRHALPGGHPEIAMTLNNLALLMQDSGQLESSEQLLREALAIRRQVLPDGHPLIGATLANLGTLLHEEKKIPEAEAVLREAVAIERKALSHGHAERAPALSNLARVLQDEGNLAEAEELLREALEILRRSQPANPIYIAHVLNNLAWLLQLEDKTKEAEQLYREALELRRRVLPAGHQAIGGSLVNLGLLLQKQNRLDEAASMFEEGLIIRRETLGPRAGPTTRLAEELARVESQLNNEIRAAEIRGEYGLNNLIPRRGDPPTTTGTRPSR